MLPEPAEISHSRLMQLLTGTQKHIISIAFSLLPDRYTSDAAK